MNQSHQNLLQWYKINGREKLPWRNTDNIYHIYISEIMLQQTQTSRVAKHFYPKFLKKFPTFHALAGANIDDVLAFWSGLGYYQRARNLHQCAKECVNNNFPKSIKALTKLPGIGRYTASALCSFGYNQKVPVVDTNISRVLKRYFALKESSQSLIWQKAETFLNRKNPKQHNLALMDLGALICTPKEPKCLLCPLITTCKGKNEPMLYVQTKKSHYETKILHLGIYIEKENIALYKSQEKLYKGLLVLPETNSRGNHLGTFKHSYTKFRLTIHIYKVPKPKKDAIWVKLGNISAAPISSLTRKALKFLD